MPVDLFPERIETERLELTALTDDTVDVHELFRVCSPHEPDIDEATEYVSWTPHATPKETAAFVESATAKRREGEGAEYVIRPRTGEEGAGDLAGTTGLTLDWDRRLGTLGVWLRKRFWGRGYSGERAAAMLELAFETLELEVVAVFHDVDNENSRRAIEKYVAAHGGRHEGRLRNGYTGVDGPVDVERYSVTRAEYEAARPR